MQTLPQIASGVDRMELDGIRPLVPKALRLVAVATSATINRSLKVCNVCAGAATAIEMFNASPMVTECQLFADPAPPGIRR
jgi:hypothetical protein